MKLIEADKVKRAMKDYWKAQVDKALTLIDGNEANKRINSYLEHNHELLKAIDELPPVQPEHKTGSWIPVTNGRGGHQCDRCGCYAPSYQSGTEWLSNFCPECNADMRGDKDEIN